MPRVSEQIPPSDGRASAGRCECWPSTQRLRILKRPTTLAGVHLGELVIPLIDEVQRQVKLTALDQPLIIYTPVAIVRVRASPAFFLWHEGAGGTSGIFTFAVG